MTEQILSDYTVIDFTHVLAGPTATRMFAEMGADVIKVELPPLGDVSRMLPFIKDGRSAYYVQQNRGKKSVCFDAKSEQGKQIVSDLIEKADIVIENFAPGVAARLGIGWEQVHKINPRAVMCSISAFGQEGPLSHLPGFDYIAQAYAGVTEMIGEPGEAPYFPLVGLGDVNTGVHAAAAIGFALLHREKTGKGQYLDISLLDAYYHAHELNVQLCSGTNGETEPTRSGAHHYAVCPLGLFEVGGRYLFIITLDPQWPSLCKAMGQENLVEDPRYCNNTERVARQAEVNAIVQAWLDKVGNMDDVLEKLNECRVPSAPVLSISETIKEPHFRQRGTIRTVEDEKLGSIEMPGMPLRFSEHDHNIPLKASYLGENNEVVLRELLGYSKEKIQSLEADGVLQSNQET